MRKVLLGALVLGLLGALACVGDDPTPGGNATNDGGGGGGDVVAPPPVSNAPPPPTAGDAGSDAPVDAGPCDLTKDFANPTKTPFAAVDSAGNEFGATLTIDELQLVFTSNKGATGTPNPQDDDQDLAFADRTVRTGVFSAPTVTNLIGLNVNRIDLDPTLSPDGKVLVWVQRDPSDNSTAPIWAVRQDVNSAFTLQGPVTVTGGASLPGGFVRGTFQVKDALYFGAIKTGDTDHTIWRAPIVVPGQIGAPVLQTLQAGGEAIHGTTVVVSADEKTMFVGTHRFNGTAATDMVVYTRASTSVGWSAPAKLALDGTDTSEEPRWVSPDGCRLYYSSDQTGDAGAYDLWVAERPQ